MISVAASVTFNVVLHAVEMIIVGSLREIRFASNNQVSTSFLLCFIESFAF